MQLLDRLFLFYSFTPTIDKEPLFKKDFAKSITILMRKAAPDRTAFAIY